MQKNTNNSFDLNLFGKRLSEILENDSWSARSLGEKLDLSHSTISRYAKAEMMPKIGTIYQIADVTNVNPQWLLGKSENKHYTQKISKAVKIPVLGTVVAGIPIDAIEEILDYEEIPETMVQQGEFFGLQIKGSSMEPKFSEGDVVIVRKQEDVDNGDIAIVLVNGNEATVKKIKKFENGINLIPTNPDYEVLTYTTEEIESLPVQIIGKVVELRAKF